MGIYAWGCHGSRGREGQVTAEEAMGIHAGECCGSRGREGQVHAEEAMGIHAGEYHGSRGPQKDDIGRRPWGYMHGNAMEVGAPRGKSSGGGRGDTCRGMPWK